jgi:CBS domain-containing protein
MNAADVMSRNVISVGPDAPVHDAIRLMLENHVSGLPVVNGGVLVGVLTEGDLLRRAETQTERRRPHWLEFLQGPGGFAEDYVRTHGRKVGELMTERVVSVTEDSSLAQIVLLMERHRVKRLPVLRDRALVGMISRADLMRALAGLIENETALASALKDAEVQNSLLAALAQTRWAPRAGVTIAVKDGVVTLEGAITDEKLRAALRVAAENAPGVKEVRDHIAWVEPVSGTVIGSPADEQVPPTSGESSTPERDCP